MRQVLEGGCKMRVGKCEVGVTLPKDCIGGERRLGGGAREFEERREEVDALLMELVEMARQRQAGAS